MSATGRRIWRFLCVGGLALWGLAGAGMARAEVLQAVVVHVTDGDTVWARPDAADARARPLKLRLLGIDAPERCQAWGAQATAALTARVLNRHVRLDTRAHDDYGRVLASLSLDGEDIGGWMVRQGHAWSYHYRRSAGPYAAQEDEARRQARGLFADAGAEEPRWFRRRHGACD